MDCVIEASADGGFDIPVTPEVPPTDPSPRLLGTSSLTSTDDFKQHEAKRISVVVVEDDDDEGDEDDGRDFPRPPPSIPTRGSCGRDQTTDGDSIAFSEETAAAVHPAGVDDDDGHVQGELATPRPEGSGQPGRFEYAIYKVEVADDQDPVLEVVLSPSSEQGHLTNDDTDDKGDIFTTTTTTATTTPACPGTTVGVLPGGLGVVFNARQASSSAGGSGNGSGSRAGGGRRVELKLPHRVVPSSARSFFWEGSLTVRATIAAE